MVGCIRVESYDIETGQYGEPIEAFRVSKTGGGKPSKDRLVSVTRELRLIQGSVEPIEELGVLDEHDHLEPLLIYRGPEDLKALLKEGLNGGTICGLRKDEGIALYSLSKTKGITPITDNKYRIVTF